MPKFKRTKLYRLYELIAALPAGERPKLIIIERKQSLFSHPAHLSFSEYVEDAGLFTGLRPERGDILEAFSVIEFIINEITAAYISPKQSRKIEFEYILNRLDLTSKVRMIEKWHLIDRELTDKIMLIKEVRDGFAHKWVDEEIKYKSKPLSDGESFSIFKNDIIGVWDGLVAVYNIKYPSIDELITCYKR